jgi:hypothetical protein
LDNLSLDLEFTNKKVDKVAEAKSSSGYTKSTYDEPTFTYLGLDYELEEIFFFQNFRYYWPEITPIKNLMRTP